MKPVYKTVGLAAALGVGAWFLGPYLLPVKLPDDFPKLPDLQGRNPSLRTAVETADKEARKKPGSAEIVGKLGLTYHANEFPEQADAAYRIAARLAPGDAQWAYGLAVLNEENGREKEQVKYLQETLRLAPGHVHAQMKLADWYFKTDRLDEAALGYERAASAASLQAGFALARVAARRHEWNKVVERIEPLTRAFPQAAPLYELLKEAYSGLGQAAKAEEARQNSGWAKGKAVPPLADPFNDRLAGLSYSSTRLLKQAGLLSRMGSPDGAIEVGRRAVQAAPEDPDVRNFLARTLLTFYGDKPEAVEEAMTNLEECLRLKPQDAVPLGGFAVDFFKSPKPPASVRRLRTLLQSRSDMPGIHFFLGQAADALGEAEEAAEHFRTAIQLNPRNTDARLNLAIELMQRGDYGQALRELDESLRINPQDAAAHFCMGFAFLSLKRIDEAAGKFRQGLRYKPDDAEAHFGLGSALAMRGSRAGALAEAREALRLHPSHRGARQLLSQLER